MAFHNESVLHPVNSSTEKNKKVSFPQAREDSPADRLPLDLIDNIGSA